ncbi:MAG TPA: chemotaxis protein CheA [Polyangiaceae bacterium]|jgi:two-component system chemotaxis sensor kinase CheA
MVDPVDKIKEEFFSEAQEIIEGLSKDLLAWDASIRSGGNDPELINQAFRAVHTLKGLAGLFGATKMGALSHRVEDVLDQLRLGRMEPGHEVLDVLFGAVEVYGVILLAEKEGRDAPLPALEELMVQLDALGGEDSQSSAAASDYDLDPGLLQVLTEYEEHRLRTNIAQGLRLYRLRVEFDLATLDRALEQMKERAKRHGEIITYLPTGEATSVETIKLDLLMASRDDLATLIGSLGADNVVVEEIPRKSQTQKPAAQIQPAARIPTREQLALASDDEAALERDRSLRSLTQTVRVDIRKLDHLMNIVGELAIVRGSLARVAERLRREGDRALGTELQRLHRSFDRRLSEMQNGILEVRMVPLGQVFDRLGRVVRQIGREVNKEIRLVITGAETEIDKLIVEELSDPLMHIIRNAIDHGIELREDRQSVGKPVAGTIALNAYPKGNHVVIEIEDDGRGIDEAALIERATALGLVDRPSAGELSRGEALALIFLPGVSTRTQAGDVSGRGVGMDVVKTNIGNLGGAIDVQSERGIGTKLTITLPITLAIVSALLVRVGDQTFAIPLSSVSEAIAFDGAGVRVIDEREAMRLRGATLALCRLGRLLGIAEGADAPRRRFVVVTMLGARRLGLLVDHLYGQQDIVVKPLGKSLRQVRGFAGATELGDQRVGLVLDAGALIEEVLTEPVAERRRKVHA